MFKDSRFEAKHCPYCGAKIITWKGVSNICLECGAHFLVCELEGSERSGGDKSQDGSSRKYKGIN